MNNNQLIIIVIAILVAGGIIGGAIYFGLVNQIPQVNAKVNITEDNNTTNITANITEDSQSSNEESGSESHYVYYNGEKIDTSKPGQFQGASQKDVDNYHPEL